MVGLVHLVEVAAAPGGNQPWLNNEDNSAGRQRFKQSVRHQTCVFNAITGGNPRSDGERDLHVGYAVNRDSSTSPMCSDDPRT